MDAGPPAQPKTRERSILSGAAVSALLEKWLPINEVTGRSRWLNGIFAKLRGPPLMIAGARVLGEFARDLEDRREAFSRAMGNSSSAFQAFVRAAYGRTRPSVRWRTSRKRQRQNTLLAYTGPTVRSLRDVRAQAAFHSLMKQDSVFAYAAGLDLEIIAQGDSHPQDPFECSCDTRADLLALLDLLVEDPKAIHDGWTVGRGSRERDLQLRDIVVMSRSHPRVLKAIVAHVRAQATPLARALLLRHLVREAFRIFVRRKVRPAARKSRPVRPLFARPRPPTAPLAPPV